MPAFVSIIIPNYNHSIYLVQRIESVLNQTYQDFEVILLDDNSTDQSREIIEKYRNHEKVSHIIYNSINSGSTFKQWDKGLSLAKGKYIWLAESDDYCDLNFLEITSSLLDSNQEISLVYCKSYSHDMTNNRISDLSNWYSDLHKTRWNASFLNDGKKEIKRYLSFKNTIPNASAVLFRKNKINNSFKDYLHYKLSGDWLFWIHLLERGDIAFTVDTINYYRLHNNSVRISESRSKTSLIEKEQIYNYLIYKKWISVAQKKYLTRQLDQSYFKPASVIYIKVSKLKKYIKNIFRSVLKMFFTL